MWRIAATITPMEKEVNLITLGNRPHKITMSKYLFSFYFFKTTQKEP